MTTACVQTIAGLPALVIDGQRIAPIAAYVNLGHVERFQQAEIDLYTFTVRCPWWVGPGQYEFAAVDAYLADYVSRLRRGWLMPRIYLATEGAGWWGALHPTEQNVLRSLETGAVADQDEDDPRVPAYLGHGVRLGQLNTHSFHSALWRAEAAAAVRALVAHCEAQPYAERIFGWHLCDGLFQEWFHWNEYNLGGMADYSPAAVADFRRWLRATYHDDVELLAEAWGRPVTFAEAAIPEPAAFMQARHGVFYDPVAQRDCVDYLQCLSDSIADCILAVCGAAKEALPQPKVTCVFYGYQFMNMPRHNLNGHFSLRKVLDSPAVDLLASPHSYSNRGEGGYHHSQSVPEAIRRAGKLHFDEIDCKTLWTPETVTWKRHISQPTTVAGTIEMLKKDAAYQLATGTAQWWMDLTDEGWFDAPELVEPLRRLKEIERRLEVLGRSQFGEVAWVASQRASLFYQPGENVHHAVGFLLRNWFLSRLGAPFDQVLVDELVADDRAAAQGLPGQLPTYKLYLMSNLFYLSAEERAALERRFRREHATVLWLYAPGFQSDTSASVENMRALTGLRLERLDVYGELDVTITSDAHPLTRGLLGRRYGTGVDREQYLRPPKTQYLPDTRVAPQFAVADPEATVLGVSPLTGRPALALCERDGWRSVYSLAPAMSAELLRNLARWAGVHLYVDNGDMVWANDHFLALYAQSDGERTVRFPRPVDVEDAYHGRWLARGVTALTVDLAHWETALWLLHEA
ncbi:MAG: beta-galactosidase [Anaerolineales bacterium]